MKLRHGRSGRLAFFGLFLACIAALPMEASAGIVDCRGFDTGGNACEVCATDRFYLGQDFWVWDWFNNLTAGRPEVVFSSLASNAFIDTMGNLALNQNGETTNTKIVSSYMPAGYAGSDGQARILVFNPRGLKFTGHPASRSSVAARVVYDLHYSVPSVDGASSSLSANWSYTAATESLVGGKPFLTTSARYDGFDSIKQFSTTTPPRRRHVECHNLYVSWCGDGVKDTGEFCDLGSQNGVPGSGCSATCGITPPGACVPGPRTGVQTAAITGSTAGLCATGMAQGFTASAPDASGNISYTWGCNGSAVGGACAASYNPRIFPPSCVPGTTTGARNAPLEPTSPGLCPAGATVGGFSETYDPATRTASYSWSCDGSAVGGACGATYVPPVNALCLPGPTTGAQTGAVTAVTPGLCRFGAAQGFAVAGPDATGTYNYTWACAESAAGGACAASYRPPVGSLCVPGPTTGTRTGALTAVSSGLCPPGATVGGFTASAPDATGNISYAWSCNGSAVGGACVASHNPTACVAGPTTGRQLSAIAAGTPGLCPTGVTVTDFVATPVGSDVNYTWGCNGSVTGGACSASSAAPGSQCRPGGVSSSVGAPLSATSAGLCEAGSAAVRDFTGTAPDNSGNVYYTWACGPSAAGGVCSSHYVTTTGGGSCNPGFTTGRQPGAISASTPGLCAAGGAAVQDFVATAPDASGVIRYTWSCNGSPAGGLCEASTTGGGGGGGGPPGGGGGGFCGDGYLSVGESCEPYRWVVTGGVSRLVPNTASPNCRRDCTYCGDGTLQPNHGEQCDSALPGCNSSCTLSTFTNPGQYPGDLNMTNPGGGVSKLSDFRVIVGDGVSVFSDGTSITFDRSYPFYIGAADGRQVCLRDSDPAIKGDNTAYCKPIAMTAPSQSLTLFRGSEPGVKRFMGNTAAIAAGGYEDTTSSSFYVEIGYLQEPVKTRVAKPAVAGTAGGAGYLSRSAGYDVGYLNFDPAGASTRRFLSSIESGNFTTVSLRSGDLGTGKNLSAISYAGTADAAAKARIDSGASAGGQTIDRSIRSATLAGTPSGTTISSETDFDTLLPAFRDQGAIRVQKHGDLVLSGMRLSGVRTIIVEDGDLRITGDVTHAGGASYAFVVKNWNVIIDASVKTVSGVFIVSNWSLVGTADTTTPLRVDGSVYGNIEPLLQTRTYIRGEAGYDALSVGVIVNYSNRVLVNPPPLVKEFVERFTLDRVAK